MNHNYYTCDHCGKKVNANDDYIERHIAMSHQYWEIDLCDKCFKELADLIDQFVSVEEEKDNNDY